MPDKAGNIIQRSGSILAGLLTMAAGAAMAYWGPTVPLKIAGAERALRGLEAIQTTLRNRKAKVDRRKMVKQAPGVNKRKRRARL
jgi:hypothetical protein